MLLEEMSGVYDIIFRITKQLDNTAVVTFLADHLAEDRVIATLQNGISEDSVAGVVGQERTVGRTVE